MAAWKLIQNLPWNVEKQMSEIFFHTKNSNFCISKWPCNAPLFFYYINTNEIGHTISH